MRRVETKVKDAKCDILDIDIGADTLACLVTSQMFLLHRCGGLGVSTNTISTSGSAYLSAAALTGKALQKGDPAFLPFSGPSGGPLQDTYSVLLAADGDLPALSLDEVVNVVPGLHTQVRRAHAEAML